MSFRKQEPDKGNDVSQPGLQNINRLSYWNFIHIFSIVGCCALSVSIQTLIPRHNAISEPKYWLETALVVVMGSFLMTTISILSYNILIDCDSFKSVSLFLKLYFLLFLTWITIYCLCFVLWTILLGYNHPMPFIGIYGYFAARFLSIVAFSVMLPTTSTTKKENKQKFNNFMLYELIHSISILWHSLLSTIFTKLEKSDLQWIMAILLPTTKESTKLVLSKVMYRIVGTNNEKANVALIIRVNVAFGVFVSTRLPGARSTTVTCIAAGDFLIQLVMCLHIITLHKKLESEENQTYEIDKRRAIVKLVLAEMCEGLVPLAYGFCFAMAYYGPNSKLIGNIGADIWAYKAVEDVTWTILLLFGLFLIDLFSMVLNGAIIWIYCKVSIIQEFLIVLQEYWYIMAVMLANSVFLHFFSNDINVGFDWTFQFCWAMQNEKTKLV